MKVLLAVVVLVGALGMIGCGDDKNGHIDRYHKKYTNAGQLQPPAVVATDARAS